MQRKMMPSVRLCRMMKRTSAPQPAKRSSADRFEIRVARSISDARLHGLEQFLRPERLAQAVSGAKPRRQCQIIRSRHLPIAKHESRHRDDGNIRIDLMEFGDRFDAVHSGHEDVADHDVEFLRLGGCDAGAATACDLDILSVTLEYDLDGRAHGGIVIDYENS